MISSARRERSNLYAAKKGYKVKRISLTKNKIPIIVLAVLLVYMGLSLYNQFNRLQVLQKDLHNIQEQVKILKEKNSSLREELKRVQSDAYIEQTAREKLGLVMPGETRIVPVEKEDLPSNP
ncbi:FtsB family cell division protein [Desulfolucanica intricata]|uniref:FtsB family cell division protein n=1 Tax=Desulfolucanica intricata TaxID=1285191 RepID=UPI000829ED74|nr:septum formation initiator family protein [Desulfolucanica intricata]